MIFDVLQYELSLLYPDMPSFFVAPEDRDQCPPYFQINRVDGSPNGSGQSGRWQIRAVHSDKFLLESEIIPAIRNRFHNQSGMFGEPGKQEAFKLCGAGTETPVLEGENEGVYYKSIDLIIYYR